MYQHADQSWVTRPRVMAEETVRQIGQRLSAYAVSHSLDSVSVILHGGEPLLVGPRRMHTLCEEIRSAMPPDTTLDLRVHTNGTQLGPEFLRIFREHGVRVGLSLDGDRTANDRHRLDHRGRSSYDRAVRAVRRLHLPENRHLDLGLLCTLDVTNDPVAVHNALTDLDPPRIDYLLPHATWDSPPDGLKERAMQGPGGVGPGSETERPTPYADWLLAVFDRWEEQGRHTPVRTFESVLSTLRGGPSLTEALGLAPTDLVVVETDGTFEQVDSLKVAYPGAPETGLDVFHNSFEDVAAHPGLIARQRGRDGISETCRQCPVVESCGGGLYSHRYAPGSGFDNPSVYCTDLRVFIDGVAERITRRELCPAVTDRDELRYQQTEVNRSLAALLHDQRKDDPAVAKSWRFLVELDRDPETATSVDTVLTHPFVRHSLLRAKGAGAPVDADPLAPLAAAAAIRAGVNATVTWESDGPEVHLPSLGTLLLPVAGRIQLTSGPSGFTASRGGTTVRVGQDDPVPADPWRPLASMATSAGTVLLDDADPGRDCFHTRVVPPFTASDIQLLLKRWQMAWSDLDDRIPGWHRAASVLPPTVLTPLARPTGSDGAVNAVVVAQAVGAVGLPSDCEGIEASRLLLRGARRTRLAALGAITDLCVAGSRAENLFDSLSDALADGAFWRGHADEPYQRALATADRAQRRLAELPDRQLTATGKVLLRQLRREQDLHEQ